MPNGKYISYFRVSTTKQGESGLGLAAQQKAVADYLDGGNWEILSQYIEIESGKNNNRPKLLEAIADCKKHKAILIIAKLDRLARNVHFISGLMESGIEFIAVDNPNANKLMLHLLAAFAEHEREAISKRTREALAAAKSRGKVLGSYGKTLAGINKAKSMAFAANIRPVIEEIRAERYLTIRAIANQLNLRQIPTAGGAGRKWHIPTVHKLIERLNVQML